MTTSAQLRVIEILVEPCVEMNEQGSIGVFLAPPPPSERVDLPTPQPPNTQATRQQIGNAINSADSSATWCN